MFQNCFKLAELDLSNFEIAYITMNDIISTFSNCNNLRKIKIKKDTYEKIKGLIKNNPEIIIV